MLSLKQARKMQRIQNRRVDRAWCAWIAALIQGDGVPEAKAIYEGVWAGAIRRNEVARAAAYREAKIVHVKPSESTSYFYNRVRVLVPSSDIESLGR